MICGVRIANVTEIRHLIEELITFWKTIVPEVTHWNSTLVYKAQGLRASSLQFISPLEFNAIFRDGFPLRQELNGWSKICDPVKAKFKHVTFIVTCMFLHCDDVTYVPALWNFQKADLKPYPYGKKYTTFSFIILYIYDKALVQGALVF